jgi:hypothetical protein
MFEEEFTKFANKPPNEADRGDVWFHAVAFAYGAESREDRQKASKHASALRLIYKESVPADQVASKIKERHGIEKLAREAAKRRGSRKTDSEDAAWEEANKAPADATKESMDFSVVQVASPSTLKPKQSDELEDLPAPTQSLHETVENTTSSVPVGQMTMPMKASVPADSRVQSPPVASITIMIKGQNDTPSRCRYQLTPAQAKAALAIDPKRLPDVLAYLRVLADALKPPARATRNQVLQYKTSGRTPTTKYG